MNTFKALSNKQPLQLSVIIVSYNVKYFLEQCLVSVLKATHNLKAEILVVDNCSQDGSKAFFEGRFPTVTFIWHKANIGFSAANNLALQQATGDTILFLNPDTILPENCLERCRDFFNKQPKAGAAGIRMVDGSGLFLKESKRGFPSPLTSFFKITGLAEAFPNSAFFARYYLGHLPIFNSNEVDVLSGAFMMVSQKLLSITGGFDETFFMYGEDIDLSYRIQQAGYKNFYFADLAIIHFKGESTQKDSAAYINTFYGAMELFIVKHHAKHSIFFYKILLRLTIAVKQLGAKLKTQLPSKNGREAGLKTMIVADASNYILLKRNAQEANKSAIFLGRVAAVVAKDAICTIDELPDYVKEHAVENILFCDGEILIADIIKTIIQLPKHIQFSYHLVGTKSIISSNDKNKSGYFTPLTHSL